MIGDDKLANLKIWAASNNEALKNLDPHSSFFFHTRLQRNHYMQKHGEFSGLMINIWRKTYKINNFKKKRMKCYYVRPPHPK